MKHGTCNLLATTALIVVAWAASVYAAAPLTTPPKAASQPAPVGTPPATAPQTAPNVTSPAAGRVGNTIRKLLVGPTPDLTAVANAITMKQKSLTILVTVNPGLKLTSPVTISIGYDGPRQTQSYVASTGNRFLYWDPEADGKPRQRVVSINLSQPNPGGGRYNFDIQWPVILDPLYDVTISPLQFKLLTDCALIGASTIDLSWLEPDSNLGNVKFNTQLGEDPNKIQEFTWTQKEISASAGFHPPTIWFYSVVSGFVPREAPSTANLIPGKSSNVSTGIQEKTGECNANVQYFISYALRQYSDL